MKNIVLTGMSGVGKSKIGKCLSDKMNWNHIDIDNLIVKKEKRDIDEIFRKSGEEYFREVESSIIKEVSLNENQIISTGGGSILREINMDNLRQNGYIFLMLGKIQRIVDNISNSTTVRPLLNNKDELYDDVSALFSSRKDKYISTADVIIQINDKTDNEICQEILDIYYSL